MKTYPKGYKFEVPSKNDFINHGWILDRHGCLSHPLFPNVWITDIMSSYTGQTLTVDQEHPQYPGWYSTMENTLNCWYVEACESVYGCLVQVPSVCAEITTESKTEPSHTCIEDQTPLMGYTICRHCGKNMKKWGLL